MKQGKPAPKKNKLLKFINRFEIDFLLYVTNIYYLISNTDKAREHFDEEPSLKDRVYVPKGNRKIHLFMFCNPNDY